VWIQAGSQNLPANWYQKALDGNFHYPCEYPPELADWLIANFRIRFLQKWGHTTSSVPKGGEQT